MRHHQTSPLNARCKSVVKRLSAFEYKIKESLQTGNMPKTSPERVESPTRLASPEYLERLKGWVLREKGDRTFSELSRILTQRLYDRLAREGIQEDLTDLSVQLLKKWAQVGAAVQRSPLECASYWRIGLLRGYAAETAEIDAITWLYTGVEPGTKKLEPVMKLAEHMEIAPLEEVAIAVGVGVRRMKETIFNNTSLLGEGKMITLSSFLISKMIKGGLDPYSDEGVRLFHNLIPAGRDKKPAIALHDLEAYIAGTAATIKPADLGLLAAAVRRLLDGHPGEDIWTQNSLEQVLSQELGDRSMADNS